MKWEKLGLVYCPEGNLWWAKTHAYIPTAEVLEYDNRVRVYFSAWDEYKIGRIGYVDLDINNPTKILFESKKPILDIGQTGLFDDSGVAPSYIINKNGVRYMYYVGFQRCESNIHPVYTGLAFSKDGFAFEKWSKTPILDRTSDEPFYRSVPSVLKIDNCFRLWYLSATEWFDIKNNDKFSKVVYPRYGIRYQTSPSLYCWFDSGFKCMDPDPSMGEFGLGRPWVMFDEFCRTYKMFYSIRSISKSYRLGYAESRNGLEWNRMDDLIGIDVSENGWDSDMICFSCVVKCNHNTYMFYNGNEHGKEGFGVAVLSKT